MKVGLKYLTAAEVESFMKVVTDPRDHMIIQLMLREGLRIGEVVGETLDYWSKNGHRCKDSDVPDGIRGIALNTDKKVESGTYVHIHKVLEGIHIEDIDWVEKRLVVRGKGGKTRTIPLRSEVLTELTDYIKPTELAPEARRGKLFDIDPPAFRYRCRKYTVDAKIARSVHPHIFRHTFAYNYLKYGGNIRALQKILGHASLAVTEKYLALVEEDVKNDLDKVSMAEDLMKNPEQAKREMAKKIADALTGG